MNENPLLQFGIAAAIIGGIILLWRVIRPVQNNGNKVKDSGEMPVDFWRAEMREIVDNSLNFQVVPILERQTEILEKMSDGIQELIIIQRDDRVRRAAAGGK